mmetsp:Transcript_53982/g.135684  ORF Transcript_53982/g.135684 Transcript_53982/m.135684 type:complete len:100 (+) Transcript_53982:1111-1410(+)
MIKLLELSSREGLRKVETVEKPFNLDLCLRDTAERPFRLLHLPFELLHCCRVLRDVFFVFLQNDPDKVVDTLLIEVLPTKMRIATRCDDLEDAIVDGQE